MASIETRSLVMLVVEDNAGDVAFLREAVAASNTDAVMRVVNDGCDALHSFGGGSPLPTPRGPT